MPVVTGCACNAECAVAVGSMDDGRRTQGVTAVSSGADGRRTMMFCAQRQTLCDKNRNCLHRNAGRKKAITQAGRGWKRSRKEAMTGHEGGGDRAGKRWKKGRTELRWRCIGISGRPALWRKKCI